MVVVAEEEQGGAGRRKEEEEEAIPCTRYASEGGFASEAGQAQNARERPLRQYALSCEIETGEQKRRIPESRRGNPGEFVEIRWRGE